MIFLYGVPEKVTNMQKFSSRRQYMKLKGFINALLFQNSSPYSSNLEVSWAVLYFLLFLSSFGPRFI